MFSTKDINKEFVCWEIIGGRIAGLKIARIIEVTDTYVYAEYLDKYGYHTQKFSKKTGKEFRPGWYTKLWLTKQGVKNGKS